MSVKRIVKITFSLIFLFLVFNRIDTGELMAALKAVDPVLYLISLALIFVNTVILALKYKMVMVPTDIIQTLPNLIRINLICRYYSMFLTAAVGQGVIRWHISTKHQQGRYRFIAAIVVERATFTAALLLAVAVSLSIINTSSLVNMLTPIYPMLWIGFAGLTAFFFYLTIPAMHARVNNILSRITVPKVGSIDPGKLFSPYFGRIDIVTTSLALALIWHATFLLRVYVLSFSMDLPLTYFQIGWMASVVLALQAIPVTLNGLGLRESVYALLFGVQGLPAEKGVLLGVLFFSQMIIVALVGGAITWIGRD
jgi:hypothetical protein